MTREEAKTELRKNWKSLTGSEITHKLRDYFRTYIKPDKQIPVPNSYMDELIENFGKFPTLDNTV